MAADKTNSKLVFFAPSSYLLRGWISLLVLISLGIAYFFDFSRTMIFLLYLLAFFCGGELFIRGAYREIKKAYFGFNALVSVSATGAFLFYVLNNFGDVQLIKISGDILLMPLLFTLINFIKAAELKHIKTSFSFIESLENFISRSAVRLEGKEEKKVFTSELEPGDIILIKPGERIPVDAIVQKGSALLDEYLLTGNILPAAKQKGNTVYAGAVNKGAEFTAKVISLKSTSKLAKLLQALKDNECKKLINPSPLEKYSAPLAFFFIAAAFVHLGWGLYFYGAEHLQYWVAVFLAVLGLSGPIQYVAAVLLPPLFLKKSAARRGIILNNTHALKTLTECTKVFIDKTGTLTTGRLEVAQVSPAEGVKEAELLKAALMAEHGADTLFETALKEYTKKLKIKIDKISSSELFSSQGRAVASGKDIYLAGRRGWLAEQGVEIPQVTEEPGLTLFYAAKNKKFLGIVAFNDRLRANAAAAVASLKKAGKSVCLVSGDNTAALQAAAKKAGIEEFYGNMFPQDKAAKISAQINLGERVIMIGDGFNDILALLKADASIAFATTGRGGAQNTFISWADIAVYSRDFGAVSSVFSFDKLKNNITKQNILFSVLVSIYMVYLVLYSPAMLEWYQLLGLIAAAAAVSILNSVRLYNYENTK